MTRTEHVEWCKERAREYLEQGDVTNAIASMLSDLGKHNETKMVAEAMGPIGMMEAMSGSVDGGLFRCLFV